MSVMQIFWFPAVVLLSGWLCFGQSTPSSTATSPPPAVTGAQQPPVKGASREQGIRYYRAGKLIDAERAFATAMAEDPSDLESVQMRGLTLYRLGQPAAAIPLRRSRTNTRFPGPAPRTRRTFVAPGFPLPTSKISTPFARATKNPNGRDPRRYPAQAAEM